MTKIEKKAMSYDKGTTKKPLQRKAIMKMTNDMTLLPTHEVLRRLYVRHSTGMWIVATGVTWFGIFWVRFS